MSLVDIEVCKADPLLDRSEELPDRVLRITAKLPESMTMYDGKVDLRGWERAHAHFYEAQADAILAALRDLPGGTMHALLVRLLQRKVSLLRVREVEQPVARPPAIELRQVGPHACLYVNDLLVANWDRATDGAYAEQVAGCLKAALRSPP